MKSIAELGRQLRVPVTVYEDINMHWPIIILIIISGVWGVSNYTIHTI